jgi:hypothetical protein
MLQYAERPKNILVFNLFFLISEGRFLSKLGIINPN